MKGNHKPSSLVTSRFKSIDVPMYLKKTWSSSHVVERFYIPGAGEWIFRLNGKWAEAIISIHNDTILTEDVNLIKRAQCN